MGLAGCVVESGKGQTNALAAQSLRPPVTAAARFSGHASATSASRPCIRCIWCLHRTLRARPCRRLAGRCDGLLLVLRRLPGRSAWGRGNGLISRELSNHPATWTEQTGTGCKRAPPYAYYAPSSVLGPLPPWLPVSLCCLIPNQPRRYRRRGAEQTGECSGHGSSRALQSPAWRSPEERTGGGSHAGPPVPRPLRA